MSSDNEPTTEEQDEDNFGWRKDDQIGIVQLYGSMEKLRGEISSLKATMNNGIKKQVARNSDCIEEMSDEFTALQKMINKNEGIREGKIKAWQVVIAIISSLGGGIAGTITVLYYLGFF